MINEIEEMKTTVAVNPPPIVMHVSGMAKESFDFRDEMISGVQALSRAWQPTGRRRLIPTPHPYDEGRGLTVRQGKFVEHYTVCGNAAEAARLAGYSAKTARVIGPENLLKPAVKAAVEARQRVFAQELGITKEEVIAGILSAIEMAREQQNPAAMISGLVQVAKLCGFYEPEVRRIEVSGSAARVQAKYAAMSDDELLSIICRGQP